MLVLGRCVVEDGGGVACAVDGLRADGSVGLSRSCVAGALPAVVVRARAGEGAGEAYGVAAAGEERFYADAGGRVSAVRSATAASRAALTHGRGSSRAVAELVVLGADAGRSVSVPVASSVGAGTRRAAARAEVGAVSLDAGGAVGVVGGRVVVGAFSGVGRCSSVGVVACGGRRAAVGGAFGFDGVVVSGF